MFFHRGVKNLFFGVAVDEQYLVDLLKQILSTGKIFGICGHKFREELLNLLMVVLQKIDCTHFAPPSSIPLSKRVQTGCHRRPGGEGAVAQSCETATDASPGPSALGYV